MMNSIFWRKPLDRWPTSHQSRVLSQISSCVNILFVNKVVKMLSGNNKIVSERMLAHPSEECGVGEIERGGDNPLGIKKNSSNDFSSLGQHFSC